MTNSVLSAINLKPTDNIIAIRENDLADANFIITNLMKEILSEENNKLCLVILHNTIGHYHNVGRKLGYDLLNKVGTGSAAVIEPLKWISDESDAEHHLSHIDLFSADKESVVKGLFLEIESKMTDFVKVSTTNKVYLVIDDISHLLDLGIDAKFIIYFFNYCTSLITNPLVSLIINCHVANVHDELIANALAYASDLNIEVSALRTGLSRDVGGVIKITRSAENIEKSSKNSVFHFRAYDREVKVFPPGQSLFKLYK